MAMAMPQPHDDGDFCAYFRTKEFLDTIEYEFDLPGGQLQLAAIELIFGGEFFARLGTIFLIFQFGERIRFAVGLIVFNSLTVYGCCCLARFAGRALI